MADTLAYLPLNSASLILLSEAILNKKNAHVKKSLIFQSITALKLLINHVNDEKKLTNAFQSKVDLVRAF